MISLARNPAELRQLSKHPDPHVRHAVLEKFAENPQTGLSVIVPHLSVPQDQEKAKELIKSMFDKHGAALIEPQLIHELNLAALRDIPATLALLEVLRDKGTKTSLLTLSALTKHKAPQVRQAAAEAMAAIKKRGG